MVHMGCQSGQKSKYYIKSSCNYILCLSTLSCMCALSAQLSSACVLSCADIFSTGLSVNTTPHYKGILNLLIPLMALLIITVFRLQAKWVRSRLKPRNTKDMTSNLVLACYPRLLGAIQGYVRLRRAIHRINRVKYCYKVTPGHIGLQTL